MAKTILIIFTTVFAVCYIFMIGWAMCDIFSQEKPGDDVIIEGDILFWGYDPEGLSIIIPDEPIDPFPGFENMHKVPLDC